MRFESGKEFFEKLMPQLPKDFPVTTCGANSATGVPQVFLPFGEGEASVASCGDVHTITLPENTAYIIIKV